MSSISERDAFDQRFRIIGDGRADILWRADDGTITNWLGQPDGGFVDNWSIASQPVSTDLQIAGVGDFNGDGRSDLLFRNPDGTLETWVGSADGSILSPMDKLWQDTLATVSEFFDEITNSMENYSPQSSYSDQNSYSVSNPMDDVFNSMFSWAPVAQANPITPIPDLLALNLNPNFHVLSLTDTALAAAFNLNFGSMSLLDSATNTYGFNMNGIAFQGTWHDGAPPPAGLNPIYVTGTIAPTSTGYFVFDAAGSGFHFSDGHGGSTTPVTGPAAFHITDLTPSPEEQAAALLCLTLLYKYSPTARALIDAAEASGVTLNILTANVTLGEGQQDGFYAPGTTNPLQLYWDPFEVVTGTNLDGSTYVETPLMLLAHELVHAGHANDPAWQTPESEAAVMVIANQIAGELNTATGSHFDTTRDNHVRTGQWDTDQPTSTVPSIARPGH